MQDYTTRLGVLRNYVEAFDAYQSQRRHVHCISADTVKFLRGLTKLSVRKFAVVLEVTPSFLSKVERGLEPLPPEVTRRLLELHGGGWNHK